MSDISDGRTKRSVAEGLVIRAATPGGQSHAVVYDPGNGTRYRLVLTTLAGLGDLARGLFGTSKSSVLVTWLDKPSTGVSICIDSVGELLTRGEVGSKLGPGASESDVAVLTELLGSLLGRAAEACEPPSSGGGLYVMRGGKA